MSLKLLIEGPDITGFPNITASSGLCPPVLLKLPPINAISAKAKFYPAHP